MDRFKETKLCYKIEYMFACKVGCLLSFISPFVGPLADLALTAATGARLDSISGDSSQPELLLEPLNVNEISFCPDCSIGNEDPTPIVLSSMQVLRLWRSPKDNEKTIMFFANVEERPEGQREEQRYYEIGCRWIMLPPLACRLMKAHAS